MTIRERIEERAKNTPLSCSPRNLELLIEWFRARPWCDGHYVFSDERVPVPETEYLKCWPGISGDDKRKPCVKGPYVKYFYGLAAIQADGFPMYVSRRAMELRGHLS